MDASEFLRRRKDRACAIILTVLDKENADRFTKERIRKVILDQINDLYCATLDVLQSVDTGTVVLNEVWLERLEEIYDVVRQNGVHHDVPA
jgi:hypothetical protein